MARNGGSYDGKWAMMRHTAVHPTEADRQSALNAVRRQRAMFANLMTKTGDVITAFPRRSPWTVWRAISASTPTCWSRT